MMGAGMVDIPKIACLGIPGGPDVRAQDSPGTARSGACIYCREPAGGHHKATCVCWTHPVRVGIYVEGEMVAVYTHHLPASWDAEAVRFKLEESSWCAGNLWDVEHVAEALRERGVEGDCLCGAVDLVAQMGGSA